MLLLFSVFIPQNMVFANTSLPVGIKLNSEQPFIAKQAVTTDAASKEGGRIQLTQQEKEYLLTKKSLKMCVDPDWMPYEKIEKGRHMGMSAEFIKLLTQQLAIPINLVLSDSWVESLVLGKQRQCDFFSLIMSTPEREKFLSFSKPYFSFPLVIATRYETNFITDIEDVLDRKLGIQRGYAYVELLHLQYPNIQLIEVESLNDGLQKVINQELFGMIGTLPSVAYEFQKQSISELMISGRLAQMWSLGLGARNDEPLLVGIFNKVITQINKKQLQKITNQWMSITYDQKIDYSILIKGLGILALFFAFFLYHHLQLKKYNKQLKYLSITDTLTKINNRIALDQQLGNCTHMSKRYQQSFSIILLDVDLFKKINDKHGHLVGDYVLKTIALLLKENIRTVDIVGRWGGEEFLIICPDQNVNGAQLLAEKLRIIIENFQFEYSINLTCSFGVSEYKGSDESDQLITRADDALYLAKDKGRNRVCIQ